MLAHNFNPSTRESEAGESLWVRGQPGLKELVPGQLGLLHRETLSQKTKKRKKKKAAQLLFADVHSLLDFIDDQRWWLISYTYFCPQYIIKHY